MWVAGNQRPCHKTSPLASMTHTKPNLLGDYRERTSHPVENHIILDDAIPTKIPVSPRLQRSLHSYRIAGLVIHRWGRGEPGSAFT
jgi:hypothetical protein